MFNSGGALGQFSRCFLPTCLFGWIALVGGTTGLRSAEPIRGVWVANVGSSVLTSGERISEFVETCERCGINTLCVVVWNRGVTVYPSAIMEREFGIRCDARYRNRDVLREVIDAAHSKKLRVWAWFEFGFASSYEEPDGGHIIRRKPAWAARDQKGDLVTKNGFQWMNAFHPEAQGFILSLLTEVASNYDVDGIQGDDRLPASPSTAGYDEHTRSLYAREHSGKQPPADCFDSEWIDWRAARLNAFAKRMYDEIKRASPRLTVAAAPSVYPWSKQEYLQDWPTWVANGWVDVISPQIYRNNLPAYRNELARIVTSQVAADKLDQLAPGILMQTADGYRTSDDLIRQMVSENRRRNVKGEILFYDAGVVDHRDTVAALYKNEGGK